LASTFSNAADVRLVVVLSCALAVPVASWAQDPPATPPATPGTAAPAAVAAEPVQLEDEGGAAELSGANEALYLKDYPRAARLAHVSMTKTKPTAEKYESAQYALAEALEAMGLGQAAAEYYFAVVEQRQNPALLSRSLAGIARLAEKELISEDQLLRGVLVEAELSNLPVEVADFLHYQRGLANLRQGYRNWAAKDFEQVSDEGEISRRVALADIVTLVREGKTEEALKATDEFLANEEKRAERIRENLGLPPPPPEDETDIRRKLVVQKAKRDPIAEARLTRARLLYEGGKYDEAIKVYQRIGRTYDTPAGEILLERAWAHFRARGYHDAMGLLYALGAPSNRDLFIPDQYVLRGLIYQRFCHFRAAKAAVADFRARYGVAVAQLKSGAPPLGVPVVAKAADELPEVAPAVKVERGSRKESETLETLASVLEEGGALEHLRALYSLLLDRSTWRLTRARDLGAAKAAEKLLDADEQANLLEYEVGVSIFRPIRDTGGKIGVRDKAERVPSGGPRTYYPFDDEFWSDELPDMRFLIQDRCVE